MYKSNGDDEPQDKRLNRRNLICNYNQVDISEYIGNEYAFLCHGKMLNESVEIFESMIYEQYAGNYGPILKPVSFKLLDVNCFGNLPDSIQIKQFLPNEKMCSMIDSEGNFYFLGTLSDIFSLMHINDIDNHDENITLKSNIYHFKFYEKATNDNSTVIMKFPFTNYFAKTEKLKFIRPCDNFTYFFTEDDEIYVASKKIKHNMNKYPARITVKSQFHNIRNTVETRHCLIILDRFQLYWIGLNEIHFKEIESLNGSLKNCFSPVELDPFEPIDSVGCSQNDVFFLTLFGRIFVWKEQCKVLKQINIDACNGSTPIYMKIQKEEPYHLFCTKDTIWKISNPELTVTKLGSIPEAISSIGEIVRMISTPNMSYCTLKRKVFSLFDTKTMEKMKLKFGLHPPFADLKITISGI